MILNLRERTHDENDINVEDYLSDDDIPWSNNFLLELMGVF